MRDVHVTHKPFSALLRAEKGLSFGQCGIQTGYECIGVVDMKQERVEVFRDSVSGEMILAISRKNNHN
ncbi:hypothetical protein [Persicitalea sp.]|uniref:hypothetical protein n=1 Tax=Persicitalea sp. TaxID=3100273 RepID=UPI00359447B8